MSVVLWELCTFSELAKLRYKEAVPQAARRNSAGSDQFRRYDSIHRQ